jgi:hypothetical protein
MSTVFPVRFENKAELPLLLLGRRPSEGELIDYFVYGREPEDSEETGHDQNGEVQSRPEDPLDTRRILSYFIRRFVQAVPGIEAEIERSAYSRGALEAALRGPTSPLALAEHAAQSLGRAPAPDEPRKTPVAVGFQLVEIVAALRREQAKTQDEELRACFTPVIARCRSLLDALAAKYPELQAAEFRRYRSLFAEDE